MAVHPFYVTSDSSSRQTLSSCGCKNRRGTIRTNIYQRSDGTITNPYTINQFSVEEGKDLILVTEVLDSTGSLIHETRTKY